MVVTAFDSSHESFSSIGLYSGGTPQAAIHLRLSEEEVLGRYFLYQASGGVITAKHHATPSGAPKHEAPKNNFAQVIDGIVNAFGLQKDELTQVCKIQSRKTLYNWINGDSKPRASAMNRMYDLLLLAKNWRNAGFSSSREDIHLPVVDGQSVFDLLGAEKLDKELILFAGSRIGFRTNPEARITDPFA